MKCAMPKLLVVFFATITASAGSFAGASASINICKSLDTLADCAKQHLPVMEYLRLCNSDYIAKVCPKHMLEDLKEYIGCMESHGMCTQEHLEKQAMGKISKNCESTIFSSFETNDTKTKLCAIYTKTQTVMSLTQFGEE